MMKPNLSHLLLAATLLTASGASASRIYTCTVNGQTVYTTRAKGNCHSADLPSIGSYSSTRYEAPVYSAPEPAPTPVSAPKANTGKRTGKNTAAPTRPAASSASSAPKTPANNSRRAILETELSNERKALGEAQKMLAQARVAKNGSVNHQEINALQSNVLDRQLNIQALQKELGRM